MGLLHFDIQTFIGQYGYAGVFVALLVEMVGIPFPAETALVMAAPFNRLGGTEGCPPHANLW